MVRFSASQSVTISVPPQPISIEAYLSQADRLVYALMDQAAGRSAESELISGQGAAYSVYWAIATACLRY